MSKKELSTATPAGVPASYDYGDDAGAGFEGTTGKDLSVPFLGILQSNSPQVEDKDPAGSESGMIFNTVTKELFKGTEGVAFLPCYKEHAYVEWVPRLRGGGFVGVHGVDSDIIKEAIERNGGKTVGKLLTSDDPNSANELVETYYVYGLVLDNTGTQTQGFAVMSFTSTKIKPYRDWLTSMYTLKGRPPMFANRARVLTTKQKNEHGTFYNFRIDPLNGNWLDSLIDPATGAGLLDEARAFKKMVEDGMARADYESENSTGGSGGAPTGSKGPDGEDIPF